MSRVRRGAAALSIAVGAIACHTPAGALEPGLAGCSSGLRARFDSAAALPDSAHVRAAALPATTNPEPRYPPSLARAPIAGEVRLRFVVTAGGRIDPCSVTVLQSTREEFTAAVYRVLPRFEFTPAQSDGRRVSMWMQMSFPFPAPLLGSPVVGTPPRREAAQGTPSEMWLAPRRWMRPRREARGACDTNGRRSSP
ncbi:MAG: energy transducer TonB [Gemmatimonadota bacterium]|nr:energy transducer TonB [Gemmatimonadota bacterium]